MNALLQASAHLLTAAMGRGRPAGCRHGQTGILRKAVGRLATPTRATWRLAPRAPVGHQLPVATGRFRAANVNVPEGIRVTAQEKQPSRSRASPTKRTVGQVMRRTLFWVSIFCAAGALILGCVLWVILSGDPIKVARAYFLSSRDFEAQIGKISEVRLRLFGSPYSEHTSGFEGEAHFGVRLVGATGTRDAEVDEKMVGDVWSVERVSIDGRVFQASNSASHMK